MKAILLTCLMAGLALGQSSYLGIWLWQVDAARAQELKLPEAAGIEVTRVSADSPAERAGLKAGDVITQFNGQKVSSIEQFSQMVRETPAGRQVNLQVYRGGAAQTMTARIGAATPATFVGGVPGQQAPRMPDVQQNLTAWRSPVLGVEAEALQGQLAGFFGVTEGVLVRTVASGSAAERSGIKTGDVITGVGSAKVATPLDITNRLRMMTGNTVSVTLLRDRQPMTLNVAFELQ
jgi:serine protease Do